MYGDIKISQENTVAVAVCLLCLEDKTSIEWVMWWELFYHFWARTVHENFLMQGWRLNDQ